MRLEPFWGSAALEQKATVGEDRGSTPGGQTGLDGLGPGLYKA